jgi:GAF domain-containing protein
VIAIVSRSTSGGVGERLLQQIISTIGSSLDLEEVLDGIVSLLSDASAVNGCFVYLLDRDRKRLILRAASAWGSKRLSSSLRASCGRFVLVD